MSDSLEQRLNRHSDAFQGLLSLIPAKYYFDEDTANQWQRKKASKRTKREAKKAKLDPESGFSAADEANRRAEAALAAAEEDSDSDLSVIYDDHGNEIRLRPEDEDDESEADEPVAKPAKQAEQPEAKKQEPKKNEQKQKKPEPKPKEPKKDLKKETKESKKEAEAKPEGKAESKPEANGKINGDANGEANGEAKAEPAEPAEGDSEAKPEHSEEDKKGISELRQKLLNRIDELRSKRKAPGTNVPGAARSREELLAQRKQRLEQKKELKRKRDEPDSAVDLEEDDEAEGQGELETEADAEPEQPDEIMFGGVNFKDGQKVGKDLSLDEGKKLKKRNVIDQLKVIENRKKKLEEMDQEKRAEIEDKAKWSRLILQSEGAKVKDDEKLLRKSVKQKKNKKLKSETEWNERKRKVADGIASREAKRNQNIANHTLVKQAKGKKQKKKLREQAGFGGKKRRKN